MDVVTSGPYTIVNCGSNASTITHSLDNLADYLVPAVQDAKQSGKNQSKAYTTFFKDSASSNYVSTLLSNVTAGPTMYTKNHYSNGAPVISCISAPGQMQYANDSTSPTTDAFTTCQQSPDMASYIIEDSPYIIICPSFFTTPTAGTPPSIGYPTAAPVPATNSHASNCLSVGISTNTFFGNGNSLTSYAPFLLLEVIVHYYLSSTIEPSALGWEVFDPNGCAGLYAPQGVENAHSYVYYVASEQNPGSQPPFL